MEVITQKEAFECAVAQVISISQTLNKREKRFMTILYAYKKVLLTLSHACSQVNF